MKKALAAAVFACALMASGTGAQAAVSLEGRYWLTTLDATIKASEASIIGTEIKPVDDLGFDDKKNFPEVRLTLGGETHKLRYGYLPFKWDGSKTITKSVLFGGTTYSASTQVNSKLKIDYHRLGYEYDFISSKEGRLGFIFDIKYFNIDASLEAPSLVRLEANSIKAPVPTIGFGGGVALPAYLSLNAEVTGLALNMSGVRFSMYDAEGFLSFRPAKYFAASAGYRMLKLHVTKDDDKADVAVKGPFAQLMLSY